MGTNEPLVYTMMMDDKEAMEVLRGILQTGKLEAKEAEAVRTAIGGLSLMVDQSERHLRQLKAKKDQQSRE